MLQVDKFLNPPKLDDLNDKIGDAKAATQEGFEKVNMSKIFKDLVTTIQAMMAQLVAYRLGTGEVPVQILARARIFQ